MTVLDYQRVLFAVFFAVFGVAALFHGIFGKTFHFTLLGSHKLGPEMPKWFARPFFCLLGAFFLWGAFSVWAGKVDLTR